MTSKIDKFVWAQFAGRCAMCKECLLHEASGNERSLLGEIAHIVGEKPGAPRGKSQMSFAARNEPDNLLLLCRKHRKIIDDNEAKYSVEVLRNLRAEYLAWLGDQLQQPMPWKINVSAFTYLNVPRLNEYAALKGFKVQHDGPPAGTSLHDLGFDLNRLMRAFGATLRSISIDGIAADTIPFLHDGYVGQLINFDRLSFRTKNVPGPSGPLIQFDGSDRDPHIYHRFSTWTLKLNIDPRWITTTTAFVSFKSGQSLFTGFARITNVDLETGLAIGSPLALGVPKPLIDLFGDETEINNQPIDFESLEDDVTRSRGDKWCGPVENCDFCGKAFSDEPYMVDGPFIRHGPWGCMCTLCYTISRPPLGIGAGQLYKHAGDDWKLVGGYARAKCDDYDE